jgi:gamma-glutamyltranspeptidase/glutathione hydrolase
MRRLLLGACAALALLGIGATGPATVEPAAPATRPEPAKEAVAVGTGGAAASVDPIATQTAIRILDRGGNAVDAAVAAAAMLGVVEPYSCGIGGGGFMVIYRAPDHRVITIDSRETAPQAFQPDSFIDQNTGQPMPFAEAVTSGLGVGVPGTLLAWGDAARHYGTMRLSRLLAPAISRAAGGFTVDQTFHDQTVANLDRFRDFTSTRAVFLTPSGDPYPVGSTFRNPDLADTYGLLANEGIAPFYTGEIAQAIVDTVKHPPLRAGATRNVRPGLMEVGDLAGYRAPERPPTVVHYRGLTVYGMGPPSSGGSTVGEALNILEGYDLAGMDRVHALHLYLEASALAFADRNQYLGDPDYVDVPLVGLLSDSYAAERRELIDPEVAKEPFTAGNPTDNGGPSTTHLTVSDRFGNVVTYTFTNEQIGGSAITVPGYGFLLNNELTDFNFTTGTANSPDGGKRPRSSMSPTLVLSGDRPFLALGSPGGATIITTVLEILVNRLDFGMTLPEAIAAPRASQRNSATTQAEPAFIASPEAQALTAMGHSFASVAEIGAATGIAFLPDGFVQAVAEPLRRGGGSAIVQEPAATVTTTTTFRRLPAGVR